jgi:hypothetical protein
MNTKLPDELARLIPSLHGLECWQVSDHVPGDPSFDGNGDLWIGNTVITFGPGAKFEIEEEAPRPARR